MKRIIIIFIIVFCLLCFMEISCLAQEGYINYGKFWLIMSDQHRACYMGGFVAGMDLWFIKIMPILISKIKEGLVNFEEIKTGGELIEFRSYFIRLSNTDDGLRNIINVVTNLYKDPTNTYIPCFKMIEIAYQELKGEDIEPLLQEARKKALLEK